MLPGSSTTPPAVSASIARCARQAFKSSSADTRMNDEDGVNRRLSASAELPRRGIALFAIAENSRAFDSDDAFLKLDGEGAQHVRRQPEPGKAAGGERDVQRDGRLQLFTGRRLRPRLRRGDGGADRAKPSLRLDGVVKLQEQVRGVRQVAVSAGDETLDVGERRFRESRRREARHVIAAAALSAAGRRWRRRMHAQTSDRLPCSRPFPPGRR